MDQFDEQIDRAEGVAHHAQFAYLRCTGHERRRFHITFASTLYSQGQMGDPVTRIAAIGDFSISLTHKTHLYWVACRAVHAPDNRRNASGHDPVHQGVRILQRLAFHADSIRRSAVYALRAAERADNRTVRRAERAALLLKRLAESSARA